METEEKISGIYRIYCKANGKSYYGQTNDYRRRMIEHKKNLRHHSGENHHCAHLQNAWNLYGEEQFEFSLIESCPEDQLTIREQWYFDTYGPSGQLFNTALCAEAPARGRIVSEETKQKLRELNSGPNNPNWGKMWNEQDRLKLSAALSGEKHHQFGIPISEETKQKIRESLAGENCHLAKLTWDDVRKLRADFCEEKTTVKEICEQYKMDKSTICEMLKNETWKDKLYNELPATKILQHSNKIVDRETVAKIREDYKTNEYQTDELAQKYGLSISGLGKITRNETWYDADFAEWIKLNKKAVKKPVRINYDTAQQIRKQFIEQYSTFPKTKAYLEIANKYNLAAVTIEKIIKNKMWISE